MADPLIITVIQHYYPEWEAPEDNGREWVKCCCPFHGDTRPSAGVSYQHNAFKCLACPAKGNAVTIVKQQEEVSYAEAQRIAAKLSPGSDRAVPPKPARQSGRRVFGDKGSDGPVDQGTGRSVPPRVRRRTFGGT